MVEFSGKMPCILVVEDDVHTLAFMQSSLELSGFEVVAADASGKARALLQERGPESFSAVLCDYRLPDGNGLDLLQWVLSLDPTISTLIITGQGEKEMVQQSLSVGVFEYLEKPVTHQLLREVLRKAVKETLLQRKYAADRQGLQELRHLDQGMNQLLPESLSERLQVFYRPLHEVGGDFFITHDYGDGRVLLLVGDVSGHDIRSGYVSTYFQGMFRGCIGSGGRIEEALELFNRSLRKHVMAVSPHGENVSLSVSAIDIGPHDDVVQHWNFGLTPCQLISGKGRIRPCPYGRFPLGWVEDIDTQPSVIRVQDHDFLYIFTDGLIELADNLEINSFSLLFRFMHSLNDFIDLPVEPTDDILALRYTLNLERPLNEKFEPILSEHYAGTEVDHIDQLQSSWRRSINFALEGKLGDRLYDLLICIREGMLNAFIHGCGRSAEKFAHLQVSVNQDKEIVRVHIDDPGRGHTFDLEERLKKISEETGQHLGLGIIQHLSDEFRIENRGTSLVFDFQIQPEKV